MEKNEFLKNHIGSLKAKIAYAKADAPALPIPDLADFFDRTWLVFDEFLAPSAAKSILQFLNGSLFS